MNRLNSADNRMAIPPLRNVQASRKFCASFRIGGRDRERRTHEESHGKGVKDEDEKELEVMSGIGSETRHPINAGVRLASEILHRSILTHIVDNTMVGRTRSGSTSKKKRDRSQAVGLQIASANELHSTR
jgi:hypothetical protein